MRIELNSPFDAHLHLRDSEMLSTTVPFTADHFAGAIVMPNLVPAVATKEQVIAYKERILEHAKSAFEPKMALFLTANTTADQIREMQNEIAIVKLYPTGITTNADDGISSFDDDGLTDIFEAMSECNIPLSIHGETDGFVMDREAEFAPIYEELATKYPKLKIIMEHISTKALADILDKHPNLYATITLHHLLYTFDDVAGGMLKPHLFCKPIIKTKADREALRKLAFSAHQKVAFGSDSAPHLREKKESNSGAAGIFSAPILLPKLAELFEANNALESLQAFVSDNAQKIYGMKLPEKKVVLVKKEMVVAENYGGVVPMCSGEKVSWSYE